MTANEGLDISSNHNDFEDDLLEESKSMSNPAGLYEMKMASSADKWVLWLRVITGGVLVAVAVSVCLAVYFTSYKGETAAFESDFESLAEKLVLAFEESVKNQFEVIAGFNDGLTSEANGSFPFYTPPNFSERMERVAKIAKVLCIHYMPLVTSDNLAKWNNYSVETFDWRPEGMARERGIPLEEVNASKYVPYIYNPWAETDVNLPAEDVRPEGPFFPIWVSYPVSDYAIANLDLFSDWEHIVPIRKIMATQMPIFELGYDYLGHMERDIRWEFIVGNKYADYHDDPHTVVLVPVFDKFGDDKQVVAIEAVYIYWRTYFDNLLPPGSDGIDVVLENTCNQVSASIMKPSWNNWNFTHICASALSSNNRPIRTELMVAMPNGLGAETIMTPNTTTSRCTLVFPRLLWATLRWMLQLISLSMTRRASSSTMTATMISKSIPPRSLKTAIEATSLGCSQLSWPDSSFLVLLSLSFTTLQWNAASKRYCSRRCNRAN